MTHADATPLGRLIVTGRDGDGRSTVTSAGDFPTRVRRPNGLEVVDAWAAAQIPTTLEEESAAYGDRALRPPSAGVCVRIAVFPPDKSVDQTAAAAYAAASADLYGSRTEGPEVDPGMHRTDTVDVVTVLSGEIWAILDTGEVHLRPGDVLIQRGTSHAWSNRTSQPCTLITTMIPAAEK